MCIKEYVLKLTQLSHYVPELACNMRARMRKFASGLSDDLVVECKGAILNKYMDISRLTMYMK